jgi:hypothetical protein
MFSGIHIDQIRQHLHPTRKVFFSQPFWFKPGSKMKHNRSGMTTNDFGVLIGKTTTQFNKTSLKLIMAC